MSLLSVDDLKALLEQAEGIHVSIFMPTVKAGSETQQNPIRFKNLIKQAEAELQNHGLSHTEAVDFLKPVMDLDKEAFWQHQGEGLAILLSNEFIRYFQLPLIVEELVVVGDRFHLKPLLQFLIGDGEFYVLTLSQDHVRFLKGSRYNIEELEVEGLPKHMDQALQYDETAKDGQFRISTSKGGTNNPFQHAGSFHGQGSPDRDDIRQDLLQYFHLIDRSLHEVLRDKRAPLVLAGVEYLMPIYREANTYPHLIEESISENPKLKTPEELHDQAWKIVEPYFAQVEESAINHYRELQGTGKTSTDLKEVVPAAWYGRVEQLFVAVGVQQWGSFDPQSNELEIHGDTEPGDDDLLNLAAIQTFLNGGTVYAVEPNKVPDTAPVAAVFRY
jgi:hypothetical protein